MRGHMREDDTTTEQEPLKKDFLQPTGALRTAADGLDNAR
jgi:hypothetical protein